MASSAWAWSAMNRPRVESSIAGNQLATTSTSSGGPVGVGAIASSLAAPLADEPANSLSPPRIQGVVRGA